MSTWQATIASAVKARGYDGQGMTREQFCFSQLCKAIEELAEVGSNFGLDTFPHVVVRQLEESSHFAKLYFNDPFRMGKVTMHEQGVAHELADVLITLVMAADVLGVDLESLAVQKAMGDVSRGVRKNPDTISP